MVVAARTHAGLVVRREDFLTALENVARYQRLVLALILHAVPLDDADVEGVLEHGRERGDGRRRARLSRGGRRKPLGMERPVKLRE
jgi:hypothetical protein